MEQRPLRLGDIVDDYCPRERRITNHAIVALVEESIRQTRCTTCDSEHVYKDGREPKRRRREQEPVLTVPAGDPSSRPSAPAAPAPRPAAVLADSQGAQPDATSPVAASGDSEPAAAAPTRDELWPAHRQLIRATLPRTEGEPPAPRPIPEFTMHQRQGRGPGFRYAQGWNGQGNGADRGNGYRQGRPVHGAGRGPADGYGNGNGAGNGNGNGPGHPRPGGRRRRGRHKPPR